MKIAENLVVGFDLGIASVGWAIIDSVNKRLIDAGVWTFSAPETDKERTPTNQIRQQNRSMRRTIKRRRQRLNALRDLLVAAGLLPDVGKKSIAEHTKELKTTPWALRTEGLNRRLTGPELAIALYHIARHRGFQSNRKGGDNAAAGEDQKALKAMQGLNEQIAAYTTFGQALYQDAELSRRKRNTPNNYGRTPRRDWLRQEVAILFGRQRAKGSDLATEELEVAFAATAFTQRALQDQAGRVRHCPFEHGEQRASKHAPSFELFRFLSKLVHLRLYMRGVEDWALSAEDIAKLEAQFGRKAKLTFADVRTLLDLDPNARFRGISKEEETFDIAVRKGESAKGTRLLRKALGNDYEQLSAKQRDDAMFAIAFYETNESVATALEKLELPSWAFNALKAAVDENQFKDVKSAAHISAKACRNIIPGLRTGLVYSEACAEAGYDHSAPDASPLARLKKDIQGLSPAQIRSKLSALIADKEQPLIGSPAARKALIEAIKQFVALVNDHRALKGALPGKVHVELSRDIGKSAEERDEIKRGIDKRNRALDKAEEKFEECFKRRPRRGSQDLLMYELAQEQGWKCLYTGEAIEPARFFDGMTYQIDHILPWSRFSDDSFHNLTLCLARANQAKKERTPYEWATANEPNTPDFEALTGRVEACLEMHRRKKRNFLLKNADEVADKFRSRNLNDTRWACKLFLQAVDVFYPDEAYISPNDSEKKQRRLYARPGAITSKARKAWGLERYKKDADGNRLNDDRHHAIDAITVAALNEGVLQYLTRLHQQAEAIGAARPFGHANAPWPEFRKEVDQVYARILVARAEERKVSGEKHKAGIDGLDEETQTVYERLSPEKLLDQVKKNVEKIGLKEALEKRFERPERSQAIIRALIEWQDAGRPADAPPLGPTDDPIGKINVIATSTKPAVRVRGGTADRGEMARVDVFSKLTQKGKKQYFLVPIYPHQIATDNTPPTRAITAHKTESLWPEIDETYCFEYSLVRKCWIEIIREGEIIEGYYRGLDRSTGNIEISPHYSLQQVTRGIGARNLHNLSKYHVNRLGIKHPVARENRTWRGEVFISGNPPD